MPDFTDHIRQAVANNHYFLTDHAITQQDERGIKEQEIREVIGRGEVIERYPDAYPCPACLFMHEPDPGSRSMWWALTMQRAKRPVSLPCIGAIPINGLMIGAREGDNTMDNTKPRLCDFCGGELHEQTLPSYDRKWQGKLYRFANVPVLVCAQCGEKYFHATVSQAMEKILTSNEQPKRFEQVGVWELSLGAKAHA